MALSTRHLALLDVVSTLQGITTDNGYANNVAVVYKTALDWEQGRARGALPAIGVLPLACPYTHITPTQLQGRQDVAIEFCYAASTADQVWEDGDTLVDDIIAALLVDRTRGGCAQGTQIDAVETEQGNPDTMDSAGGTAAGVVRITLLIVRDMTVS